MSIDLDLLKTFLEVNRTRHFGVAAENLFITQSTVSARVRQLEQNLGASLFTRTRNDIQLTPIGQKLVQHAESIITTWNRARQELATADEQQSSLVVSGIVSLWDIILDDWLVYVHEHCRNIALHIELLHHDNMVKYLLEGVLDLAFTFDPPQMSSLEVIEIHKTPLVLVSSTPALNATEAVKRNYILVDWGDRFALTHAKHFPGSPTPRLRTSLSKVALNFLLKTGGSCYLAEPMIRTLVAENRLHLIKAPIIDQPSYAVFPVRSDRMEWINSALAFFVPQREPREES